MDWKEVRRRLLRDPEVRTYYHQLAPHYNVVHELVTRRKALNMTQARLAALAGTTQSMVARVEAGESNITLRTLERMAQALGCTLVIGLEPKSVDGPEQGRWGAPGSWTRHIDDLE